MCLKLYRHVTLRSPFFCSLYHRNVAILKPRAAGPQVGHSLLALARNARDLCNGRQTGRAAVQIGQTLDIQGMCKRSRLVAEGVEQCQGSAAEGVRHHGKHPHTKTHTHNISSRELWSEIKDRLQCQLEFLPPKSEAMVSFKLIQHRQSQTDITAHPLCPLPCNL